MNFYIGTGVNTLDLSAKNVEINDDLLQYIIANGKKAKIDLSLLVEIAPYADEVIHNSKLNDLLALCNAIIESSILDRYEYKDEADCVKELCELLSDAIQKGQNVISIGD